MCHSAGGDKSVRVSEDAADDPEGDESGDAACCKEARKTNKDDPAAGAFAESVDEEVEGGGVNKLVAAQATKVGSNSGVELDLMGDERQRTSVVEDGGVALGPELVERDGAEDELDAAHSVGVECAGAGSWCRRRVDGESPRRHGAK
ncbi:Kinase a-anchor protein [Globisporangium polare]